MDKEIELFLSIGRVVIFFCYAGVVIVLVMLLIGILTSCLPAFRGKGRKAKEDEYAPVIGGDIWIFDSKLAEFMIDGKVKKNQRTGKAR